LKRVIRKDCQNGNNSSNMFNSLPEQHQQQQSHRLGDDGKGQGGGDWVLFNGFVVSRTTVDDAQAFHVSFKDPCVLVYEEVDMTKISLGSGNNDNISSAPASEMTNKMNAVISETMATTPNIQSSSLIPSSSLDQSHRNFRDVK